MYNFFASLLDTIKSYTNILTNQTEEEATEPEQQPDIEEQQRLDAERIKEEAEEEQQRREEQERRETEMQQRREEQERRETEMQQRLAANRAEFDSIMKKIDDYLTEIKKTADEDFGPQDQKSYKKFKKYTSTREIKDSMLREAQQLLDNVMPRRTNIELIENVDNQEEDISITVSYETPELQSFMNGDNDIQGTISNIVSSGFGGKVGTPQKMAVGGKRVKHQHVTGRTAVAFYWSNQTTLCIAGYGIKSNSAPKGSGGYNWDTKPK